MKPRKRDRRRQTKAKLRGHWPPPWTTLPDTAEAIERGEKAAPRPAEPMMLVPIGGRLVAVPAPQPAAGAKDQARPQDLGRKADRSRKHPTGNPRKCRKPKAGSVG